MLCIRYVVHAADEGSGNESSSELELRQEWDAESAWRPWAVHPDPIGVTAHSFQPMRLLTWLVCR